MRSRRFGTFAGGIDLPDDKDATLSAAIAPVGRLERLRVPLAAVGGDPPDLTVEPGRPVTRGERLTRADTQGQVDVFAPLAGRVAGFAEVMLPDYPFGWRRGVAVELTDLDEPAGIQDLPEPYEWQAADGHSIRMRIAEGGLTTFRAPLEPLGGWVDRARRARVGTLIANFTENTPFVTADHRLLSERGSEVIRGVAILARAVGAARVILAVDRRRTDAYREAVGPARLYGIESIALPHKYPIGADAMVVKVLTRRRIRPGGTAFDAAAAVADAATCWATYRWVACGEPPTARVVTLAGPGVAAPANLLVPVGADAREVLALAGAGADEPAVYGSAMQGAPCAEGAVVTAQANALLALKTRPDPVPTPCIRCGWCIENCPAMLNVAALNDDFELARIDRARRRGALACIDCGICSYLCPARLRLARRVGLLKQAIRQRQKAQEHVPAGE